MDPASHVSESWRARFACNAQVSLAESDAAAAQGRGEAFEATMQQLTASREEAAQLAAKVVHLEAALAEAQERCETQRFGGKGGGWNTRGCTPLANSLGRH